MHKYKIWIWLFLFFYFEHGLSAVPQGLPPPPPQGLYFLSHSPLISSFGGAGRAGQGSAEYHILNASALVQSSAQAMGFYFFNQESTQYGGSIAVQRGLPLGVTWIREGSENRRVFSVAGKWNQYWAIGGGIHYLKKQSIIPHIGLLYTPIKNLRLGFTGDVVNKELVYGLGVYYDWDKKIRILSDIVSRGSKTMFHGGVELLVQNIFSLRGGLMWPDTSYRAGVSFISFPIKVDYTWIQNEGHSIGLRIQSSLF